MEALAFWYVRATGIRKKLINLTFKKGRFSEVAEFGPFSALLFGELPTLIP